jgi:hypothetical protein
MRKAEAAAYVIATILFAIALAAFFSRNHHH